MRAIAFLIIAIGFVFSACKRENPVGPQEEKLFVAPGHFPQSKYDFSANPLTEKGVELGRRLFYDPLLSRDGSISCASCHVQQDAFAHRGFKISPGIEGRMGFRHSPPLFNLAWMHEFMWDGGVNHLDVVPVAPITDENEMDHDLKTLLGQLNNHPEYPTLFEGVFDRTEINDRQLLHALSQFMVTLVSAGSKYDRFATGQGSLTPSEKAGLELVKAKCAPCHQEPLFTDFSYRNNGLDETFTDAGRARITLNPQDSGKFKVPSLRNVALTPPYMHDGRFATLHDVLEHYTSGVKPSQSLDATLTNGISLTEDEKSNIISFLQALTDEAFVTNPAFSAPRP